LTGSMVGALVGIEAIPAHWREQVENADVLQGVAENLAALVSAEIRTGG
jgi:ADP-ribosylglycohydrolase